MSREDDKLLEEYLQGESDLSRLYQMHSDEKPPHELDNAILEAAWHSVRRKPRIAYSPFTANWMVPASLAAVLLISVSLVVMMPDEAGLPPAADLDAPGEAKRMPAAKSMAAPGREAAMELEESVPAAKPAPEKEKSFATPPPAPVSGELRDRGDVAPAVGAAASASRPEPVSPPDDALRKQAPTGLTASPMQQDVPTQPATMDRMEAAPQARFRATAPAVEGIREPEEWLAEIGALLEQGHIEEARRAYRAFLAVHPDYPVNEALRGALEQP